MAAPGDKSGFVDVRAQMGAGLDLIAQPSAPEDAFRIWIKGEQFPRVVFDVVSGPLGRLLVGNGASPPTDYSTGGGGAPVTSVNGHIGDVVLDPAAIGAQPHDLTLDALAGAAHTAYGISLLDLANTPALLAAVGAIPQSQVTGLVAALAGLGASQHLQAATFGVGTGDDFTSLNAFFGGIKNPFAGAGTVTGVDAELPAYAASVTAPDYRSCFYLSGPSAPGAFKVFGQGSSASTITIKERIDASGTDGVTTPGTNVFSSSHVFVAADVGKFIRAPYVAGGCDSIASISGGAAVMSQPVFPIIITGFTNAQTWSLTRGVLGHVLVPTSVVRGGGSLQGNVVTAIFPVAHKARIGQKLFLRLPSRGMNPAPWVSYPVFSTPDQFTLTWIATSGEVVVNGVGIGQTISGGNLDALIPPANTPIYFSEFALEILNMVSAGSGCKLDGWALLRGGKPTFSPLDGLGVRWANRVHLADYWRVDGFFMNAVCTGTPDITAVDPAVGTSATVSAGKLFNSSIPIFDPAVHVGATITTSGGSGGVSGGSDTIAAVNSTTQAVMTKAVTTGSGQTFSVGWKPQNTDHHWLTSRLFTDATGWHVGWLSNSSASPFRSGPYANKPGLGGGRDEHIHDANFGGTNLIGGFFFDDAGNFESQALTGVINIKGGSYPLYFQGPDGLDPCEAFGIDGIYTGAVKIESPGNKAIIHDESFRRTMWLVPEAFEWRLESGITINGLDQGTPGGGGTNVNAGAQFGDFTDRPWPVTDVSLVTVGGGGGMPTIKFTGPGAMFGGDGGRDIGTGLAIGGLIRYSGLSGTDGAGNPYTYATDGQTVVGGAGAGLFRSATARFTSDDIGLRVDSLNVAGGSDTIKSINSATEVVMTGAITVAASGVAWVIRNDGTKSQAGAGYHGRIKTVTAPDVNGLVTCTMDYPTYASALNGGSGYVLPELLGPYVGAAGELGMISCGTLDEWNPTVLPETESLDTECHHQQFIDVHTLRSSSMRYMVDDVGPSTRKLLMPPRVLDALSWRKINGQTYQGATTLNGAIANIATAGTITVASTTGFTNGVSAFALGTTRWITYTSTDATHFFGCKLVSGPGGAVADTTAVSNTTLFTSARAKFTQSSVGASLTASGIGLPSNTTTVAVVINKTTIFLTDPTNTATTNVTYTVGNTKNLVPFKSEIRVGSNRFEIMQHSAVDANAVAAGSVLEFFTGSNGNLTVMCSTNSKNMWAGVAATASPVGGATGIVPTCTTSGTVGVSSAKVLYNGPILLMFSPGDTVDVIDYPVQVLASAAIPAGMQIADDGDVNPGMVARADTKTAARMIGQAIGGSGGSPLDVPARLDYARTLW